MEGDADVLAHFCRIEPPEQRQRGRHVLALLRQDRGQIAETPRRSKAGETRMIRLDVVNTRVEAALAGALIVSAILWLLNMPGLVWARPVTEVMADGQSALAMARLGTDGMAELVARHPHCFARYVSSLPMNDPEAAAREAARAFTAAGANGIRPVRLPLLHWSTSFLLGPRDAVERGAGMAPPLAAGCV